ncbi:GntR family transcriptional regulator [Bradyrhizobium sp. Arg314]
MAETISKRRPMHREIADQLRRRIAAEQYEGAELPRELSLMEEFGVSRHTIRTALQHLVDDGLIERRAGSGTKVTERAQGGIWAAGKLGDLIGEFTPDQYLTLSIRDEPATRFPAAAALFDLGQDDLVFHVLRMLMLKDLPYALVNMYALRNQARLIPEAELGIKPLVQLIEQYAKVRPARVRQVSSANIADEQVARQLGVQPGTAVLHLQRTYFDSDGRPFLHVDLLCRPDRYQHVMDFVHETPPKPA